MNPFPNHYSISNIFDLETLISIYYHFQTIFFHDLDTLLQLSKVSSRKSEKIISDISMGR